MLLRGPLLNAFALGWAFSMIVSSTVVPRLVIDGAISFLFVPLFQLLTFAMVYRRAPSRPPFGHAIDRFFAPIRPAGVAVRSRCLVCRAVATRGRAVVVE